MHNYVVKANYILLVLLNYIIFNI